jgi:hypothetical protein
MAKKLALESGPEFQSNMSFETPATKGNGAIMLDRS